MPSTQVKCAPVGVLDEDREVAGPLDHPAHRDTAGHVGGCLLGEGPGPRPRGGEGGALAGVQLGQAGAVDGAHDRIMPCPGARRKSRSEPRRTTDSVGV